VRSGLWLLLAALFLGCYRPPGPLFFFEPPEVLVAPPVGRCPPLFISPRLARAPYLQSALGEGAIVAFATPGIDPRPSRVSFYPAEGGGAEVAATEDALLFAGPEPLTAPFVRRSARLFGLSPGRWYCYDASAGDELLARGIPFRAAPDDASKIRVAALGDFGAATAGSRDIRDQLFAAHKARPFDLAVTVGDNANPVASHSALATKVFAPYASLLMQTPLYPALGNHDYYAAQGAAVLEMFFLPEGEGKERYYSFDVGPAHFVALDTEAPLGPQVLWLERDLAAAARPFTIVYLHRPPYNGGRHGPAMNVRAAFAPLFEAYGVDLVLAGHDHNYQRLSPPGRVLYVVSGGGGAAIYSALATEDTLFFAAAYQFLELEITRCRLSGRAVGADGAEIDAFELRKCAE
jgi:acid phosphatase type 7